jgi:hypothetical protein
MLFLPNHLKEVEPVESEACLLGKTVPSYRVALECEIERWKGFRRALPDDETLKAFDELMDMCRNNAMASGAGTNPILFEPMVMSILVSQTKRLSALEEQLNVALAELAGLTVVEQKSQNRHAEDVHVRDSAHMLWVRDVFRRCA